MLIRVIAVGTRMPRWVDEVSADYSGRLRPDVAVEWKIVKAEPRLASGNPSVWMAREAERIRQMLPPQAHQVVLDEHGRDLNTRDLATRLQGWRDSGKPLAILIGGADGLDGSLKTQADEQIRLSSLTLPHPLVRVLLAEQLFRAWSMLTNHPYHRGE